MKRMLSLMLLVCSGTIYSNEEWSLSKQSSPLSYSVDFPIKNKEGSLGKVVRSGLLTPRYNYDLYDSNNHCVMSGVTRAFSLGFFYTWRTEIDLYDDYNQWIGMIFGEFWTNSRAKFAFYDSHNNIVAYAYLNDESCNFIFISSSDASKVLAELEGKSHGDASSWKLIPTQEMNLDQRMLYIFAAFAADFQKDFIRPPQSVHHHHYE